MAKLSDHELDPVRKQGYQRGFAHGANAVIESLEGYLDKHRLLQLKTWLAAKVTPWSTGQGENFTPPSIPDLSDRS